MTIPKINKPSAIFFKLLRPELVSGDYKQIERRKGNNMEPIYEQPTEVGTTPKEGQSVETEDNTTPVGATNDNPTPDPNEPVASGETTEETVQQVEDVQTEQPVETDAQSEPIGVPVETSSEEAEVTPNFVPQVEPIAEDSAIEESTQSEEVQESSVEPSVIASDSAAIQTEESPTEVTTEDNEPSSVVEDSHGNEVTEFTKARLNESLAALIPDVPHALPSDEQVWT